MLYVYKITNIQNQKAYIGWTKYSLEGLRIKDVAEKVGVSFDVAGVWSRKKW